MKKLLIAAGLLLAATSAFAADAVKVTVGHMCCGSCKASATAGIKKLDWVADSIAIDGTTVSVTPKEGQQADVVGLMTALRDAGFPAKEITVSGPVTMTVGHLCCGGCVNALKTNIGEIKSQVLDTDNVKIDQGAKTVTMQPLAGKNLNLVALIRQMENAGVGIQKVVILQPAAAPKASPAR